MQAKEISKTDYDELLRVWEESVRATHDFLPEYDIVELRSVIRDKYFDALKIRCIKNDQGSIQAFIGVSDDNIEMLFVSPSAMNKGYGKHLLNLAVNAWGIKKVDVNEQNPNAVVFYEHFGFKVVSRSSVDGEGKPYPLLHMKYSK